MRRAVAEREVALAGERARAESILRSLAEGLCLLDDDLRIVFVNPRRIETRIELTVDRQTRRLRNACRHSG